jgi:hypothetical protein
MNGGDGGKLALHKEGKMPTKTHFFGVIGHREGQMAGKRGSPPLGRMWIEWMNAHKRKHFLDKYKEKIWEGRIYKIGQKQTKKYWKFGHWHFLTR